MKLSCLLLVVQALIAQDAVRIQGTVINSISQEPLNKVRLFFRVGKDIYATETRSGGSFTLEHVKPGRYFITAERAGFRTELNDQGVARQIEVESGGEENLVIKMDPLCVIRGRVIDADGDPVRGATITAMRYDYNSGKRQLNGGVEVTTDDRGDYRLYGLGPGRYYVRASNISQVISMGQLPYLATFFPNAQDPGSASSIALGPGSEARGIDITLRHGSMRKVSGTLPKLPPMSHYSVTLIPRASDGSATKFPDSMGGRLDSFPFRFDNVPPGSYELVGTRVTDGGQTYFLRQPVDVGTADVDGLVPDFSPGFDVAGRLLFDGDSKGALDDLESMGVRFKPVGAYYSLFPHAPVKPDGTFVAHNVAPAEFEIDITGNSAAYLKTLQLGEHVQTSNRIDFTRAQGKPLALRLANDFGTLEGTVKDEFGEPVFHAHVTPISSTGSFTGSVTTDAKGHFQMAKVPPGDYRIFAWDQLPQGASQDAEFRKPYEKLAKEIRVLSNGRGAVDLVVVRVVER
jgi:Carboxypeptidase regulatory-like domain